MDLDEKEYDYKPKWTAIFLGGTFFAACTVGLGFVAANNDRGLMINHVIELEPGGATVFYWVLAVCSLGFVGAGVIGAYHRLTVRQRIKLGSQSLIVPSSFWSSEEKEIAYDDIHELSTSTISGQRLLNVKHIDGKVIIAASKLPSKAAFEEMCKLLAVRVGEAEPAG